MLEKKFHKDWTVLVSSRDGNAFPLFQKFIDGEIPQSSVKILADGSTGPVYKIGFNGKIYILKHDKRRRHRFDYLVQSVFRGSNAFRLLRSLDAASAPPENCGAAEIFLAADRRFLGRIVLESFVLMEFIDGHEVWKFKDGVERFGNDCAKIVHWLHENGIVHGDIHSGNFMVENKTNAVRVIDLSGKTPTAGQIAFDRIRLEEKFGVKNEKKNWAYYFIKFRLNLRKFKNKIRGNTKN